MKRHGRQDNYPRREFLRRTAATGVGTMAALALPGGVSATPTEEREERSNDKGYRLTKHIVDYYKAAAE